MKKQYACFALTLCILFSLLLLLIVLNGCSNQAAEEPETTEPPTEIVDPVKETEEQDEAIPDYDYDALYADVLEKYIKVAEYGSDFERIMEDYDSLDVSHICSANNNIGYQYLDVDSDGICELLIGALDGNCNDNLYFENIIYDMYTLKDKSPERVSVSFSDPYPEPEHIQSTGMGMGVRYALLYDNTIVYHNHYGSGGSCIAILTFSSGEAKEVSSWDSIADGSVYESKFAELSSRTVPLELTPFSIPDKEEKSADDHEVTNAAPLIDRAKAYTFVEEFDGENFYTTVSFTDNGEAFGFNYIPETGYILCFRGTYSITGNVITLSYFWNDGVNHTISYAMSEDGDNIRFTQSSDDGLFYYHEKGAVITFYEDPDWTPASCKEKCLQCWDSDGSI